MDSSMKKLGLLGCVGLLLVVGLIALVLGMGNYNKLNVSSNEVDGKWANVQAQYQRRADLIPNLVNTVQGSANFEKSTLTEVINARSNATKVTIDPSHAPTDPAQLAAYQKAQDTLSGSLSRLLVVSERYPELKSTTAFRDLQAQIEGTENRINDSRNQFNTATQAYNTQRRAFPTVLFANLLGYPEKPFFKASEEAQNAPTVNFGSFGPTPTPAAPAPAPAAPAATLAPALATPATSPA